jgi:hypothetical protein
MSNQAKAAVVVGPIVGSIPMADFDVSLSSAAIQNIVIDGIQEDFVFVVGGQGDKCPRMMAEFLSPRVCLSHLVDPSIAEYVVETPDSNAEFDSFMSLGAGSTIRVTEANRDFFLSLSGELGNSNLYISLMEDFDSDSIPSQIHNSSNLDLFSEDLIGRIATDFSGLTSSQLEAIPVSVLFHILSHDSLMISSEDDLFLYISSRICSDPEYLNLLQFVCFEGLSAECFSSFLSDLPDFIDRRLWESLSWRLISRISWDEVEFPLKEARSLDGIISYLTRKHGGNLHEKEIVTICASSGYDDDSDYAERNRADLTSESYFCCERYPFVVWDFHELRVRPTHYTISSAWLKSWVVDGSLDDETWTEIDRKTDNNDFKGSFAVSNSYECRFIRLTQTDDTRCGEYSLFIDGFEVFGTLLE